LRKAMKGLGTDEAAIIAILSKRTSSQRRAISDKFRASFGKSLEKELKSELGGNFEDAVVASLQELPLMNANALKKAMAGAGTRESTLIQVLVSSSNAEIKDIVSAYKEEFKKDLNDDIGSETSGDFKSILIALCQGCREEANPVNASQAQADAEELYKAGEARSGTEEATFNRILSQNSFPQIKEIAQCYEQRFGKSLVKAIKKEASGNYENTLVALVRWAIDRNDLMAEWFYETMAGAGTCDQDLIRLTIARSEFDLGDIKEAYARKYQKPLAKAIEGDCSGDYKKFLIAIVGGY